MFTSILSGGAAVISDEMILAEFDALTAPGVAGVAAASVIVLFDMDSSEMVGTEGRWAPWDEPVIAVPCNNFMRGERGRHVTF